MKDHYEEGAHREAWPEGAELVRETESNAGRHGVEQVDDAGNEQAIYREKYADPAKVEAEYSP